MVSQSLSIVAVGSLGGGGDSVCNRVVSFW